MLSPLLRGRKVDRLYPGIREGGKCRRRKEGKRTARISEKSIKNHTIFYLSKIIYVILGKSMCTNIHTHTCTHILNEILLLGLTMFSQRTIDDY